MRVSHSLAFVLPLLGAAFAAAQPIDQIPMYGGTDRGAQASLRETDEKLISDTSKYYGSRAAASAAFVKNGFAFYGRDDLANAMRRFNQAWLLNPNNPEVYWGFGAVRHDQGRNCESMGFFDRAASFNKYVEGMAPDAARIKTLCALDNKGLSEAERDALLAQADAIYSQALEQESNKGYVHSSMATAFSWRGKYPEAWAAVKLARASGARMPEQFLKLLREKMPEPE